jgi:enoyl-CoA hydratase/carnithine racemase
MADPIRLEIDGAVARIVLNRPEVLNAGNAEWVAALGQAVSRIADRPAVRVVAITGAGRAFCSGVDLHALAGGEMGLADFVAWEEAMTAIERMTAVVVAGINGHCLGGGLQLALVCDYRLASEDAQLGLPAVREGLIPSMALHRLPRLIGLARAKELILTGEPLTARDAERCGLVSRVVPADDFPRALDETIARFLALPAASLAAGKRLTGRAIDLEAPAFRAEMEREFRACLASAEHRAAMEALRGRRGPPRD